MGHSLQEVLQRRSEKARDLRFRIRTPDRFGDQPEQGWSPCWLAATQRIANIPCEFRKKAVNFGKKKAPFAGGCLGQIVRMRSRSVHWIPAPSFSDCPEGKYLAIPLVLYFAGQSGVRLLATCNRSAPQASDFCSACPDPSVADRASAHTRLLADHQSQGDG